jgi:hypothetical protein
LHTIKHSQGSIDARLRRFPIATRDAKLRIATAHKEPSVSARPILLIVVAHGMPAPVISIAIPPVIIIMPAVAAIPIVVPGALAPG